MRHLALVCVSLLVAFGMPGCNGDSSDKVRIAVCGPMTGSAAAFGAMIKKAAKLKEKEVNAAGGITLPDGTKKLVEFVIYDDKGDAAEAANVARKVAGDSSIVAVVGHFNSTCSLAAKDEYNQVGIVEYSPGSTNVTVCKGGPYTFRNLYRDDFQGQQVAKFVATIANVKSVAVLYDNDDYGKGLKNHFVAAAKGRDLTVTKEVPYIRERTADFKPLVAEAKNSGAEALFISGLYGDAALIVKAVREAGWEAPIIGGDGVMNPTFIKNAGAAAEGVYITTPFLLADSSPEVAKAFGKAFTAEYGAGPDTWAALTYDACGHVLQAIQSVGLDRAKIKDYLAAALSAESPNAFKGVTGVTYFDSEGDCPKPLSLAIVKDGAFVFAPKQLD